MKWKYGRTTMRPAPGFTQRSGPDSLGGADGWTNAVPTPARSPAGHRAGGHRRAPLGPRLPLRHEQFATRGERRGLRHRGRADGGERRAGRMRHLDPGQLLGRVRPQRHTEPRGGGHDPRLLGLGVDGHQLRDTQGREPRPGQGVPDQPEHLVLGHASGRADPDGERGGPQHRGTAVVRARVRRQRPRRVRRRRHDRLRARYLTDRAGRVDCFVHGAVLSGRENNGT